MGSSIQHAAEPLDGYLTGFAINAAVMVASGLLGLLLLWPNTERARLMAAAGHSNVLEGAEPFQVVPAKAGSHS
jgi:hypothetical protein